MDERPMLEVLVGIPGSGKSTYAKKEKIYLNSAGLDTIIVSTDGIREEMFGTSACQDNPNAVFSLAYERMSNALKEGKNVIFDATNKTRKDRAIILSKCPKYAKKIAVICWAPIETCIERDKSREIVVTEEVITRMVKKFQVPFYDEGFDHIKVEMPKDFYNTSTWQAYENNINSITCKQDNPHHTLDVLNHCMEAFRHALEKSYSTDVCVAARYHDIGKPFTKIFTNSKGETTDIAHFYGHENVGAWMSIGLCEADLIIPWLINNHMEFYQLDHNGKNKYLNSLPETWVTMLKQLHECDQAAH